MSPDWRHVLFYLLLLSCTARAKQFYVIPSSSTECPSDPCYSLGDVVQNPSQYFVSNTAIKFLPGHHQTNITKDLSVLIKDVKNISMIGYNESSNSVIHCTGSLGFAFINVTMLVIAKLSFAFCGAHFPFPVEEKFVYLDDFVTKIHFTNESKVTFYFLQTSKVTISEVNISNSLGAGLLGINMLGLSNISQTVFTGNRPNCLIIFLDIPSASQTIPPTALNIEDSDVMFGKIPNHSNYTYWGATGLGIMLAQSTYNVHILASNIEAYNNMKMWNWFGNLHFVIENWECWCSMIQGNNIASTNIVEEKDKTGIYLKPKTSNNTCNCSKPTEEEYTVQISDSYFVGVGIDVVTDERPCDARVKLRNLTVQNTTKQKFYIFRMTSIELEDVKFTYNEYKLYLTYSNIKVFGRCHFINNTGYPSIVYLDESNISFHGNVKFIGNKAKWATVILVSYSTMKFHQTAQLEGNEGWEGSAIASYGGSQLICGKQSEVLFLKNYAQQDGGAILAESSTLVLEQEAAVTFIENEAYDGGALALQDRATIMLNSHSQITFIRNHAQRNGGALHVADPPISIIFDTRGYWIICFFELPEHLSSHELPRLVFSNNTANSAGSSLYGGSIDLCTIFEDISGIHVFKEVFHFQEAPQLSTVSSNPTRVCVCNNNLPNCTITQYNVTAYPGETIQVSAVAVGQMLGTVPFTVQSKFTSDNSGSTPLMKALQGMQKVRGICTTLTYTIASSHQSEDIILTVDKPDKYVTQYSQNSDKELPLILKNLHLHIQMTRCPLGFVLVNSLCVCHPQLQKHEINCSIDSQKINRRSSTWINATFANGSGNGVLVHEHCPFDYCKPESFDLDLEDPDEQCAFHRSGILCGACQHNLSHVLGTSACRECSSMWVLLWVPVIALAGIALVVLLIVLNLTVSVGTINSLIFYANIVRANHATFFPPNTSNSFLSWFIAWINLDLGIETCFYDGLDAYVKTWLQFVFPLYIWFLVITIIVLSHYSTFAARLSGRNAVPVLATLFLLSYTKLLRIIITVFQSTELKYPDNSVRKVWLYDGNIDYLRDKHIPLFIAAHLLLLIFLPYTAFLIFIQFLQPRSSYKLLSWVQKLKPLFDAYTGPYKDRHRYWTGLLLLVRIVLFLIISLNSRGKADINLLAIISTVLLLLVHLAFAGGVYKTWYLNIIQYSFFLNLGILSSATFYTMVNGYGQIAVVYTSVGIAFALFVVIAVFHVLAKFKFLQEFVSVVSKPRLDVTRFRCKQKTSQHNSQPRISHTSIELRESLL